MPIRPEHRWLYPIDWRELSWAVRFERAGGRCEHCRRPHGREVIHLGEGTWWDEDRDCWRTGRGRRLRYVPAPNEFAPAQPSLRGIAAPPAFLVTRVVLATAHLNYDPQDNRVRNLAALCQRCHLAHDRPEHRRQRWRTLFRRRALGDLFLGAYR